VKRSIKISLALATATKLRRLNTLLCEVRSCTQHYVNYLWDQPGRLDTTTLNQVSGGSLSYRHRSNCLKVALETISATRKAAKATRKRASCPIISGRIRLSSLVAKVECGKSTFDYVLKVSCLTSGKPITIPFKSHKRLNHWLNKLGAKLLQGCVLGDGWAALWIDVPDQQTKAGSDLGVDIGINKLFVDSNGNQYGTGMKAICAKVRRCKPGSKRLIQVSRARKDYINLAVKQLPWDNLGSIGVERLKNLKLGKKPSRGKTFRKAIAPWTYRQAITRIEMLAQENRVRLVAVDPRNTSRTCPICKTVAKESRRAERFCCVSCGFAADADHVSAVNVLVRAHPNSEQSMVARCFQQ
jgi:hypothetical protein